MPAKIRTIEELKKEIQSQRRKLKKLRKRRRVLAVQLTAVDRKIASLAGEAPPAKRHGRKARKARKGRRRRATGTPLIAYLEKVLAGAKGGLRVKAIVPAVVKAGYKSHSKDFYRIVASTLRDKKFKKLGRGVYTLAR